MEQPKVLPHILDTKILTIKCGQADLFDWHYCLGHSSFKMLKALSIIRILPHHLAKAQTPMCTACSFDKMYLKPWQTKGQHKEKIGKNNQIWSMCVCGPTRVMSGWILCSIEGKVNSEEIHCNNNLCG